MIASTYPVVYRGRSGKDVQRRSKTAETIGSINLPGQFGKCFRVVNAAGKHFVFVALYLFINMYIVLTSEDKYLENNVQCHCKVLASVGSILHHSHHNSARDQPRLLFNSLNTGSAACPQIHVPSTCELIAIRWRGEGRIWPSLLSADVSKSWGHRREVS